MTIITGTSDFQTLFQGLLSEIAVVNGQPYGVPIVKLTNDSPTGGGIAGIVAVSNFPATQNVNLVSGTISVSATPMQGVSGSVSVDNFPQIQGVSGSVGVSNFPSDYRISGSVFVDNFPSLQAVSGTVFIGNHPSLQGVSGSVSINNFPNLQIVSGSVLSLDFPTYAEWDYFGNAIYSGTNLYHGVFRRGGASGTILATIDCTYDASDNLLTVTRT